MKNRKLRWACMLLTICMLAEPMAVRAEKKMESTETESAKSDVQSGERTATIMVVSITGNELTYYEVEDETEKETESEVTEQNETDVDTEGTSTQKDSSVTSPGRMQQGDGMPQGDRSMTPPNGMSQSEETMTPPDGASQSSGDSTGMPENLPSGDFPKGDRSGQQDTKTVYLPVPVVVHTDTDEKRTFSILEAGDRLQVTIVTDEEGNETITEIWMLNE